MAEWPTAAEVNGWLGTPSNGGAVDARLTEVAAATVARVKARTLVKVTEWQDADDARDADTIPDDVHLAALMQAAKWYRRKDSPDGVAGASPVGQIRVSRWDPDVEALLMPWDAVPHA